MSVRGNMLAELRRSNAAGIHDHKPSRSELRRLAITESYEEDDMSVLDGDYPDSYWDEPTAEDLDEIEAEEYVPDPDDVDYGEGYYDPDLYRDDRSMYDLD